VKERDARRVRVTLLRHIECLGDIGLGRGTARLEDFVTASGLSDALARLRRAGAGPAAGRGGQVDLPRDVGWSAGDAFGTAEPAVTSGARRWMVPECRFSGRRCGNPGLGPQLDRPDSMDAHQLRDLARVERLVREATVEHGSPGVDLN